MKTQGKKLVERRGIYRVRKRERLKIKRRKEREGLERRIGEGKQVKKIPSVICFAHSKLF